MLKLGHNMLYKYQNGLSNFKLFVCVQSWFWWIIVLYIMENMFTIKSCSWCYKVVAVEISVSIFDMYDVIMT